MGALRRSWPVAAALVALLAAGAVVAATGAEEGDPAGSERPAGMPRAAGAPGEPSAIQWDRYAVAEGGRVLLVPYTTTVSATLRRARVREDGDAVVVTLLERRRRGGRSDFLAAAQGCVRLRLAAPLGERAVAVQVSDGSTRPARVVDRAGVARARCSPPPRR